MINFLNFFFLEKLFKLFDLYGIGSQLSIGIIIQECMNYLGFS